MVDQIAKLNLKKDPAIQILSRRRDEIGQMSRAVELMQDEFGSMTSEISDSCAVVKEGVTSLDEVMKTTNDLLPG